MGLRDRDSTDAYGRSNRSEREGARFRKYRKGYERYFEGYGVETTTTPSGKSVSVRVYRGTLYRQELTEAALRRNRLLHTLMAIAAAVLVIASLCLPAASNYDIVAFVFSCLPLIGCVVMLYALRIRFGAELDMKIYEYRNGARLLLYSAPASAAAAGLSVLASLLILLIRRRPFSAHEALRLLMQLACGALCVLLWRRERSVRYTILPGENETGAEL